MGQALHKGPPIEQPVSFIKSPFGPGVCREKIREVHATTTTVGRVHPPSTWNSEPTTTSARREIGAPDQKLSAIGIYAAGAQVYR